MTAGEGVSARARSAGHRRVFSVDGNDVEAVDAAARQYVARDPRRPAARG
jgi:TPP-dependent pyruvate/acetoin dehydrogenase alpha subunit